MAMSDDTSSSSSPPPTPNSAELMISLYPEIARECIQVREHLGVGSFGSVYKGLWTQAGVSVKVVALKKVFMLQKEAEILSKIRHRNIIEFYGICKSGSDFFIVTEYAENGSLYDHLHHDENVDFDFSTILKWAREIAAGIYYLHYDAVVTIIHRDLKSKNVVLDSNFRCKICDFGTSKDLTHSCTAPTWGGTAAWMSPEIINQNEGLTTTSDVWSYGVVLWEMLSREIPYKDFTEFRIYTLITQQGVTLAIPDSCPPQLANLMRGCWKMQPKERLTMRKIVAELSAMNKCPETRKNCESFFVKEDWKKEIEQQKIDLEEMRKRLEKQREKLNQREKALQKRVRLESALIESCKEPPADVNMWSEQHTVCWVGKVLGAINDTKFLERVKASICRHRITGARLLDMTQKDFEHIGVNKLGCRMELMKAVRNLKMAQNKFVDFPTLEQAHKIILSEKQKGDIPISAGMGTYLVLLLGFYNRPGTTTTRLKFYVDVDWDDDEPSTSTAPPSKLIKSVCFSILDDETNKPLNEPSCYSGYGNFAMEWVTMPENVRRVKVFANVHYADRVSEPRSTEMAAVLMNFDRPSNLIERRVQIRAGRRSCSTTPQSGGLLHTTSSPILRGVWQKKASESRNTLLESEIAIINGMLIEEQNVKPLFSLNTSSSPPPRQNSQDSLVSGAQQKKKKKPRNRTKSQNTGEANKVHGGKSKWAWKSQQTKNLH